MRTVHESVFKPKLQMAETKFIVDIRPVNHNAAALSRANAIAAAANNNNTASSPLAIYTANLGHGDGGVGVAVAAGAHHCLNGGCGSGNGGRGSSSRNFRSDVNWRRVFTVSSLIVSLLLISGSIFLHLRQKPHLGRLRHEHQHQQQQQHPQHVSAVGGVAPTPDTITSDSISVPVASAWAPSATATTSDNSFAIHDSGETTATSMTRVSIDSSPRWNTPSVVMDSRSRHITEACMQCICTTATECRPAQCSNHIDCGVFRISQPYWLDAGKPTLEGDESYASNTTTTYAHCVNNIYCATRTVAAYISKYARDCNGDGVIGCRDHIALHLLGPSGCTQSEGELSPIYVRRIKDCLAEYE